MLRFGSLQPTSKLNGKLCLRLKRCVCLYYIHTLHVYDFIACEYAFSVLGSGKEIIIFDLCHAMFIKLLFVCITDNIEFHAVRQQQQRRRRGAVFHHSRRGSSPSFSVCCFNSFYFRAFAVARCNGHHRASLAYVFKFPFQQISASKMRSAYAGHMCN